MIRRPPRSTLDRSSAASDVYKRQILYLVYIAVTIFLFVAINIYKGFDHQLKRNFKFTTKPKLSLIIAAKNEEQNIYSLIDSLEKLNYPNENFEVIFVDDNSTDKTAELIQSRISNKNNYTLITACLLYTSDAADERSSVDLGGRRTIKKKT